MAAAPPTACLHANQSAKIQQHAAIPDVLEVTIEREWWMQQTKTSDEDVVEARRLARTCTGSCRHSQSANNDKPSTMPRGMHIHGQVTRGEHCFDGTGKGPPSHQAQGRRRSSPHVASTSATENWQTDLFEQTSHHSDGRQQYWKLKTQPHQQGWRFDLVSPCTPLGSSRTPQYAGAHHGGKAVDGQSVQLRISRCE